MNRKYTSDLGHIFKDGEVHSSSKMFQIWIQIRISELFLLLFTTILYLLHTKVDSINDYTQKTSKVSSWVMDLKHIKG